MVYPGRNNMAVPSKIKNRITVWSSNSTFKYIPKRNDSNVWKRYLYTRDHSIIHGSQKGEATQMSINSWMDKQNVAFTYNRILFSLKKEGNSDTCYKMLESWIHYAKLNKPGTKRQTLYESTYMRCLK